MTTYQEKLREEIYKYTAWIDSSGLKGKERYKALADFCISKMEAHDKLFRERVEKELRKTERTKVDYRPDTAIESYHEKTSYNYALSDVLSLHESLEE